MITKNQLKKANGLSTDEEDIMRTINEETEKNNEFRREKS